MNYMEWALQRSLELWRERDKALRKRLILAPEGTARGKSENAKIAKDEKALGAEESENAKSTESAAADLEETAAARLYRRLGVGGERESGSAEKDGLSATGMDALLENAALLPMGETESTNGAAIWMQKLLHTDGRDGARAAAAKEQSGFAMAQKQETREAEPFSLSLERDARRYDGGFLFY